MTMVVPHPANLLASVGVNGCGVTDNVGVVVILTISRAVTCATVQGGAFIVHCHVTLVFKDI